MKVLSIQQPWASLIVLGHKKIETRSWSTKYRGPLLIHASTGKQNRQLASEEPFAKHMPKRQELIGGQVEAVPDFDALPFGAIIGQLDLVDVFAVDALDAFGPSTHQLTAQERAFGDYSPGRYGWLLSDPVVFDSPIPAKGKLGLWEHDLRGLTVGTRPDGNRVGQMDVWLPTAQGLPGDVFYWRSPDDDSHDEKSTT